MNKGDDSVSIVNQRLMLTDYALDQGFQIISIYSDDNESGLYDDRPGFENMIKAAKTGEVDVIIAKSQSRFSRNMEHIEKYLHKEFPLLGVRFIGVTDGVDTFDNNNKKARQINGLVNEWYCEDLSQNIKQVFKAKMEHGQFLAPSASYGYVKDPEDHNHLIIDEYAAKVVRKIFLLYIQGNGKNKIANILTDEKILTPTLYKQKVLGINYRNPYVTGDQSVWSYQTIHTILNNKVYLGHLVQHKTEKVSYKSKKIKKVDHDKWIIVENTHEPIISQSDWNIVQEIQKMKYRSVDGQPKYPFAGKLFCADCKKAMELAYQRRTDENGKCVPVSYVCKTYKRLGKERCESHKIDMVVLEDIVLKSIQNEAANILKAEDIEKLNALIYDEDQKADTEEQERRIDTQLSKIKKYKKMILEQYSDGIITEEEFKEYLDTYVNDENMLALQKESLLDENNSISIKDKELKEWEEHFKNYIHIDSLDREVVLELIDRIYIHKDCIEIIYQFRNPYE